MDFINILNQIYYTLIYPYLSYGIAWGCASNSKLNFLFVSSRINVSEASFLHMLGRALVPITNL